MMYSSWSVPLGTGLSFPLPTASAARELALFCSACLTLAITWRSVLTLAPPWPLAPGTYSRGCDLKQPAPDQSHYSARPQHFMSSWAYNRVCESFFPFTTSRTFSASEAIQLAIRNNLLSVKFRRLARTRLAGLMASNTMAKFVRVGSANGVTIPIAMLPGTCMQTCCLVTITYFVRQNIPTPIFWLGDNRSASHHITPKFCTNKEDTCFYAISKFWLN